jgi:hypothetical protein
MSFFFSFLQKNFLREKPTMKIYIYIYIFSLLVFLVRNFFVKKRKKPTMLFQSHSFLIGFTYKFGFYFYLIDQVFNFDGSND